MKPEQLNEGVLCQLKIGRWGASVRLSKDKFGEEMPRAILRGMQDLVTDKTVIKEVLAYKREAKRELVNSSLGFPVDNVFWVPKSKIDYLDTRFTEIREQYLEKVEELIGSMSHLKRQFRKKYPEYYDSRNYPNEHEIRAKHHFNWRFFQFQLPDKKGSLLSPEMYKREQKKFQGMVEEMNEMAITVIGNTLLRRIDKLREQCDGDKINAGTLNSMDRLLEKWDDLWKDTVDSKKLQGVIRTLRIQMKKTSADKLRNSEEFREQMAKKMETVAKRITKIPDFKLKRKLDI